MDMGWWRGESIGLVGSEGDVPRSGLWGYGVVEGESIGVEFPGGRAEEWVAGIGVVDGGNLYG